MEMGDDLIQLGLQVCKMLQAFLVVRLLGVDGLRWNYDCGTVFEVPWLVLSVHPRLATSRERVFSSFLPMLLRRRKVYNNYCFRGHKSHWCYLPSRHIGCCSQWCWAFSGRETLGTLAWLAFWDLIQIEHAPTLAVFLRMSHLHLKLHLIATCVEWKSDEHLQIIMVGPAASCGFMIQDHGKCILWICIISLIKTAAL